MNDDLILESVPSGWEQKFEGGESIVYDKGDGEVAKIYRHRKDVYFGGDKDQQKAAARKLKEVQTKLPNMPDLPDEVVVPKSLIRTPKGGIYGYTMDYISDAVSLEMVWNTAGTKEKLAILRRLIVLVKNLHSQGVLIGDFVPRDILWSRKLKKIYLLDSDALDFGKFRCRTFSIGYVHPNHVNFRTDKETGEVSSIFKKLYTQKADWFSFYAICLKVLVGIHPFQGIHELAHTEDDRVMKRITVFHDDVRYPDTAIKRSVIPRQIELEMRTVFLFDKKIIPKVEKFTVGGSK
ncbi:hypothetical protein ACFL2R_02405 [Patescibacteria group bacterium]